MLVGLDASKKTEDAVNNKDRILLNSKGVKVNWPEGTPTDLNASQVDKTVDIDLENLEVNLDYMMLRHFWVKTGKKRSGDGTSEDENEGLEFWKFAANCKL